MSAKEGLPWFRFNPADFLSDHLTRRMEAREVGAYMLLLMHAWPKGGRLPSDRAELRLMARCEPDEWDAVWAVICQCWKVDGDEIVNPRLAREHEEATSTRRELSAKRSAAGRLGGKARAANLAQASGKQPVASDKQGQASLAQESRVEETTGEVKKRGSAPARRRAPSWTKAEALAMVAPEDEGRAAWERWLEHLWLKKRPTRSTLESHLSLFARYPKHAEALIAGAIDAGASGFPNFIRAQLRDGTFGASSRPRTARNGQPAFDPFADLEKHAASQGPRDVTPEPQPHHHD